MKLNEPISEDAKIQMDELHIKTAKSQAKFLLEISRKMESEEPLSKFETKFAVAVLREASKNISTTKRNPFKGETGKKIPDEAIFLLYAYRKSLGSLTAAEDQVSELYGVDKETLQSAIKRLKKRDDIKSELRSLRLM